MKQISDELLEQLLTAAWERGFNTSTERCNGEFPQGLVNECNDDVKELIAQTTNGIKGEGLTMELESQLERTIVEGAEQRLREMQAAAQEVEEHPEDFEGPWRGTWPLVELAHVANSGLSEAAIQRLLEVEQEANALYRKVDNELSTK